MAKRYKGMDLSKQQKRCGPIVTTNFTVFWICLCFIMELASLGTNRWYVRQDKEIKFWHGGLWNQCLGEIDRTFCSYIRDTPDWLRATQSLVLIALFSMFINIIYIMVGIARKSLRLSVMLGMTNFTTFFFLIGVIIYTAKGFSDIISPSTTYYLAWITVVFHVIAAILCVISFVRVSKLSKKKSVDSGMRI